MASASERCRFIVLVVQGTRSGRDQLRYTLNAAGYRRVATVATGREAIGRLQEGDCDLLITGMALPDIDAWQLLQMVRSGRFCRATLPAVVIGERQGFTIVSTLARELDARAIPIEDLGTLPEIARACLAGHGQEKPQILLIEDHPDAAGLARQSLETRYQVTIAPTGERGLECWRAHRHDLVLIDLNLPGISGEVVLREIHAECPEQPTIIVTAFGSRERHHELVQQGAREFLWKPFSQSTLRNACDRILRHRAYTVGWSDRRRESSLVQEVDNRLVAAQWCLGTGQSAMAAHHVRGAILARRAAAPSDDEWMDLLREFPQGSTANGPTGG